MKRHSMSWIGRLMLLNGNTDQSDLQVPFNPIKILITLSQKVKHLFDSEESRSPSCTWFYKVFPDDNVQTARWKYLSSNLWVDFGVPVYYSFQYFNWSDCVHACPPTIDLVTSPAPFTLLILCLIFQTSQQEALKVSHTPHNENTSQVSGKNIATPRTTSYGFRPVCSFRTHW